MSALTGHANTSRQPPLEEEAAIQNNGWWPDVSMVDLRHKVRVNGDVNAERLREYAKRAILDVNNELKGWQVQQVRAGFTALEQVKAEQIDGQSALCAYYLQAIYASVDALTIEHYRDQDTTGAGDQRAESLDARVSTSRRNVRWAIKMILGHENLKYESPQPIQKITVTLI